MDKLLFDQFNSMGIQDTLRTLMTNMPTLATRVQEGDALSLEIFALLSRLDENSADTEKQAQLVLKVEEWEKVNL